MLMIGKRWLVCGLMIGAGLGTIFATICPSLQVQYEQEIPEERKIGF